MIIAVKEDKRGSFWELYNKKVALQKARGQAKSSSDLRLRYKYVVISNDTVSTNDIILH